MENNKCSNCGATVNPKTMVCDYCGTTYNSIKSGDAAINNQTVIRLSDKSIIGVLKGLNPKKIMIAPIIGFMIFWCAVCIGMGVGVSATDTGFFGFIPFIFCAFGLAVMLPVIRAGTKGSLKKVIEMCKGGDFNGAMAFCEQNENKSDNYKLAYLLIKVHHFNDYSDAQLKLNLIPVTSIAKTLTVTPVFAELAKLYSININTAVNSTEIFNNNNRNNWGGGFGGFGGFGGGFGPGGRFR